MNIDSMFWEKIPTNSPSLLKIPPQTTAVTMEAAPTTKARWVSRNQATSASRGAHSIRTAITWRRSSTPSSEEDTTSAGTLVGKWRALGVSLWTPMCERTSVTSSPAVSTTSQPHDPHGTNLSNYKHFVFHLSQILRSKWKRRSCTSWSPV